MLSFSFHNSIITFLPIYLTLMFFILKNQKRSLKYYLGITATFVLSFFLLYLPVFIYFFHTKDNTLSPIPSQSVFISSLSEFFSNFLNNILKVYISPISNLNFFSFTILLIFLFLFSNFPSSNHKNSLEKKYSLIIFISNFLLITTISLLRSDLNFPHYLILNYAVGTLFITKIIISLPTVNKLFRLGKILLFLTYFVIIYSSSYYPSQKSPTNRSKVQELTQFIREEIAIVQNQENLPSKKNFVIKSYVFHGGNIRPYPALDPTLLLPLELSLKTKLTTVTNDDYSLRQLNDDKYILLACYDFVEYRHFRECLEVFFASHPNYQLIKHLKSDYPYSLYLTKKIST